MPKRRLWRACIYTLVSSSRHILASSLLDNQIQTLESAMLVAQTSADKSPVHRLRTSTRRMEAQLVLVSLLPAMPEHTDQANEVQRLLRRVRRAAATVRDMDVQIDMIEADMPDSAAVHTGTHGDQVRKEAQKLLKKLHKKRSRETTELTGTLKTESKDLAEAMRALQSVIQGAPTGRPHTFSALELSEQVQNWFAARARVVLHADRHPDRAHALQRLQHLDETTLHDLRKIAKQCRYMAESLPEGSPEARKLAQRFEYLQESGGTWHDWLTLECTAARVLGKKSPIAERYRNHRNAALAEFHLQLALEFTTGKHGLRTAKHPYRA
ncbi:CHAD domain-containing protein [Terriglobus sp.]|uniref:CHAD domain-containing protein n=1 Tax=Terriglobus sp. TaxID=1889013 RepID=UPI003B00F447